MTWYRCGGIPSNVLNLKTVSSASGAIASFDTDLQENLVKCLCNIVATQESGTPTPDSPKAITGFSSVVIEPRGRNILPFPYRQMNGTYGTITMSTDSTGKIHLSGTNGNSTQYIFLYGYSGAPIPEWIRGGVKYSVYPATQANKYFTQMILYGSPALSITGGNDATLPDDLSGYTGFAVVIGVYANAVLNDDVYPMVIADEYDDTEQFESYTGTPVTVSLGQTVYGGYLNLTTGEMTITHGTGTFTGDASETWYVNSELNGFSIIITDMKVGNRQAGLSNRFVTSFSSATTSNSCWFGVNSNRFILVECTATTGSTVDDLKTWLSSNNVTIVYPLAIPTTVQLTPHQIQTLNDQINNIYCDSGDIEVDFLETVAHAIA